MIALRPRTVPPTPNIAMRPENVLQRARFDPKLKLYWNASTALALLFSCIGIPVLVAWFLGLGKFVVDKWFERLECVLTDRALKLKRGYWFRTEQSIPLDKITDLTLHEGPLLRKFGLCTLHVETAGGNQASSAGLARLTGVVDAVEFRDAVLEARDDVALGKLARGAESGSASTSSASDTSPARSSGDPGPEALLVEIRDGLRRIEDLVRERGRN